MSNCILCSTPLKFGNTPTFGSGNLADGGTVCINCYKKINKANPKVALKLKNFNLSQINELLETKIKETNEKTSKLDEIKAEMRNLNISNASAYFGRREINELPAILSDTEKINNIVQGTYDKGNGILVSTDRRLIFIDKGLIFGLKV